MSTDIRRMKNANSLIMMNAYRASTVVGWFCILFMCLAVDNANAQIVTDGSVGQELALEGPDFIISDTLGTQRGSNLFHSFSDFNINAGQSATFTSEFAGTTENIISRVTGTSSSNIDGLLQSDIGGASLWFINPNGIVFGPNASLSVTGSFHATTADYVELGDGGRYGADVTEPNNTLLTVTVPSAFGFLDAEVGTISVQSVESASTTLEVSAENTLSLVGRLEGEPNGGVAGPALDGAILRAPSGGVHLVSVASPGLVALRETATTSQLAPQALTGFSDPDSSGMGTIEIVNSTLDVSGEAPGRIFIRGGAFTLEGSLLDASASDANAAGSVDIAVQGAVVTGQSRISASNVDGPGGDILMRVEDLAVKAASHIVADTMGVGNAGSVQINAADTDLNDEMQTGTVSVRGFSSITSNTFGAGNAGLVEVVAEQISLADAFVIRVYNPDPLDFTFDFDKGIQSSSGATGTDAGTAGKVFITARQLVLESGSDCIGFCLPISGFDGALIGGGAIATGSIDGGGGEIRLRVEDLNVEYGGIIAVGATHSGGKGSVLIEGFDASDDKQTPANSVSFFGNGFSFIPPDVDVQVQEVVQVGGKRFTGIIAGGQRSGGPGDVSIISHDVRIDTGSFIIANATDGGDAGSISFEVDNLVVASDSAVKASSEGTTGGGRIDVRGIGSHGDEVVAARSVLVDTHSSISSSSESYGLDAGGGGDIEMNALTIEILERSRVNSTIENGEGRTGGTVTLRVDELTLTDARIETTTYGSGDAGDIFISGASQDATKTINISAVETFHGIASRSRFEADKVGSNGNAGTISIFVHELTLDNNPLNVTTRKGVGGVINLHVDKLNMINGGVMSAATAGSGAGGSINITGLGNDAAHLEASGEGSGIFIDSLGIGSAGGPAGSATLSLASMNLSDSAQISATTLDGHGGSISVDIEGGTQIKDGAAVIAGTDGIGDAGTIAISAHGNLDIIGGEISSRASDTGQAGDILIKAPGQSVLLERGAQISVSSSAVQGRAGNVTIAAEILQLDDGSRIDARALESGALAGNVNLQIVDSVRLTGSVISGESASADTSGGSFLLTHPSLLLLEDHSLIKGSSASESGGNVNIAADAIIIDATSAVEATGGLFTIGSELVDVVQIDAPEILNASAELQTKCTRQQIENRSTLVVERLPANAVRPRYELSQHVESEDVNRMQVACR